MIYLGFLNKKKTDRCLISAYNQFFFLLLYTNMKPLTASNKKELCKNINFYTALNKFGDPWGNRTPDTAVKGRCLNRLTNGPEIGGPTWDRTRDQPVMSRRLYR